MKNFQEITEEVDSIESWDKRIEFVESELAKARQEKEADEHQNPNWRTELPDAVVVYPSQQLVEQLEQELESLKRYKRYSQAPASSELQKIKWHGSAEQFAYWLMKTHRADFFGHLSRREAFQMIVPHFVNKNGEPFNLETVYKKANNLPSAKKEEDINNTIPPKDS